MILSNTSLKVDGIDAITGKIPAFEKLDLRMRQSTGFFKRNNDISGVIHFAASKAVGECRESVIMKTMSVPWFMYCRNCRKREAN
jgi:UDP-glucose 4-epimerase